MAIDFDKSVKQTVLPNGVTVITDYYDRPDSDPYKDVLCAEIIVHTGSLHDPADKNGLAHFAEHMILHAHPQFKTLSGFWTFSKKLGLDNFNLETNDQYTFYYVKGPTDGALKYIQMIAESMHAQAYTAEHVDYFQRPRIINEMRDRLTESKDQYFEQLHKLCFGDQPHSKWAGGLPRHLRTITLDEIHEHHNHAHRTGNITLLTTGSWPHEQACAWAADNLDTLPQGPRTQTLKSYMIPKDGLFIDPFLSHPEAGSMAHFRLSYDRHHLDTRQKMALSMGSSLINEYLLNNPDYYSLYTRLGVLGESNIISLFGSKVDVEEVRALLTKGVQAIKHAMNELGEKEFTQFKRLFIGNITRRFNEGSQNPAVRVQVLHNNYLEVADPLQDIKERQAMPGIQRDEVIDVVTEVFAQRPLTFYTASAPGDFPTGRELQMAWRAVPHTSATKGAPVRVATPSPAPGQ